MVGDIDLCWLFAYRVPAEQVERLLPKPLELVRKGGFAYINVVISELRHMRPAGLPSFVGLHYWHIAYRLYCRYRCVNGQVIEGLYFLRSDADKGAMVFAGNLLTDFRFHRAKLIVDLTRESLDAKIESAGGDAEFTVDRLSPVQLPPDAPFADLAEAKKELQYKPAAFFVHHDRVDVLKITRNEEDWQAKLVKVDRAEFEFLKPFDAKLEICYELAPIHYQWNRAERFPLNRP